MLKAAQELVLFARILKANGTDGELVMGVREADFEDINIEEPVFVIFDGSPVPFFIQNIVKRGTRKCLVKLNDICNLEDAQEVIGKDVYVEYGGISNSEDSDALPNLDGWTLYDGELSPQNLVGKVLDFIDVPGNPCIEVDTKNGAVLIPLHQDLIISLDPHTREAVMDIPSGLI